MPRRKAEQAEVISPKLREVAVELGSGKTVAEAVKKIGVTEQTYYRWKRTYGGPRMDQAKRLKELEKENSRPKPLLADAELDEESFGKSPRAAEGVRGLNSEPGEAAGGGRPRRIPRN